MKVFVFRTKSPPDCASVAAARHAMPPPDEIAFERCWSVPVLDSAPLDVDWRDLSYEPESPDAGPRACEVAVLRADGMPDTAVFWDRVSKVRVERSESLDPHDPHGLHLERFGDSLVIAPTSVIDAWPVDWPLPPVSDDCGSTP